MSDEDPVKALLNWKRDHNSLLPNQQTATLGALRFEVRSYACSEDGSQLWKAVLFGTWEDRGHPRRASAEEACERFCERLAAPALLARIEAGEGLLREARERLWNLGFDHGFCAIDDPAQRKGAEQGREIEGRIDAFLAGKEANRG